MASVLTKVCGNFIKTSTTHLNPNATYSLTHKAQTRFNTVPNTLTLHLQLFLHTHKTDTLESVVFRTIQNIYPACDDPDTLKCSSQMFPIAYHWKRLTELHKVSVCESSLLEGRFTN